MLAIVAPATSGYSHLSYKSLASFRGKPLIMHALNTLTNISDDVLISTNDPDSYDRFGTPMVADIYPAHGPLAGLHAGLRAARHDLMAVVPCDMPFASGALLLYLAAEAVNYDVVLPTSPGEGGRIHYEPLHAVYRRSCLPAIEAALKNGVQRVRMFYPQVSVREVHYEEWCSVPEADLSVFANVNTPGDLEKWMHAGP